MRKICPSLIACVLLSSAPLHADPAPDSEPTLTLDALRAKYGDAQGHIANIHGVDVYYKDEGAGPVILMVHGSISTLKTYDFVAPRLIDRYRVIRYDIPPGGLSGPVSDEATTKLKPVDIAEGLLEKLHIKSVTCVGVSSGGTLCVFLAAKHPDMVKRLILANTPSDPVDTSHMQQPADFVEAQRVAKQDHFQSQHFWDLFLSYFAGDPARMTPQIREQYYDFNRRVPEKNPVTLVARVADHQAAVDAMSKVTAPTLIVWGARDPLLTPPTEDALANYLTHAQVSKIFLPDVGHYPPMEVPDRFAQIVAAYIEAVTADEALTPKH